jgi:CheY-like chemotaxis protein
MYEDDKDDRYITETTLALQQLNIHIHFLTNADDVMPCLEQNAAGQQLPDLILLDKNTPSGDSFGVLSRIKQHPVYRKIPVVVISGSNFRQDVEKAYELGANSYIQKPANNKLTVEKISSFADYWFKTVELPA